MEVRTKQAIAANMEGEGDSLNADRDGIVTPRPIIGILAQARVCRRVCRGLNQLKQNYLTVMSILALANAQWSRICVNLSCHCWRLSIVMSFSGDKAQLVACRQFGRDGGERVLHRGLLRQVRRVGRGQGRPRHDQQGTG